MWGTASIMCQDIAHETARKYAVTADRAQAEKLGKHYTGRWAYVFVKPNTTEISIGNKKDYAIATVSIKPRIQKMYIFEMPEITKKSSCLMEYAYRNLGEFE